VQKFLNEKLLVLLLEIAGRDYITFIMFIVKGKKVGLFLMN